jgi:type I site-specific restriction endonuclease
MTSTNATSICSFRAASRTLNVTSRVQCNLPNATIVDLTKGDDIDAASIVLSTYPTIANRIDRSDGNKRIFGSGHFDLIIVDEAHRSIYKKYRALFDYFDGLLVGLTATPRSEIHRDTYRIFDLEPDSPTSAYTLEDAIADGYLVPPKGVNVPFKFLRADVKYADLTPKEQEEYEQKFRDEDGEIPDQINATALNNWLVQTETWWTDATPSMIENIRFQLRDLIKFIDREEQTIVYTDFVDELEDLEEVKVPTRHGFSSHQYRKKVEAYIRDNQNHVAIAKLKRNQPLIYGDAIALEKMVYSADIVESREQFQKVYGDVNLKTFVRKLVGLDRNVVKKAFNKYLKPQFDSNQIRFVEMIIDYLTQNGTMDPGMLYEGQFADLHQDGLDGVFSNDNEIEEIIAIVGSFNANAAVKFGAV